MPKPALAPNPSVSSMTITFTETDGVLIPDITFNPVGKITAGLLDKHFIHIQRAIQQAQVQQRTTLQGT